MMKIRQKHYSDAFRRHVCEELKSGKWTSTREASRAYNISAATVAKWLDALGYGHLRQRTTYVKTPAETSELAKLKAEVKELKAVLFDEMIRHRIDRAALEIACEKLGVSPESLKKKNGSESPDGR